MFYSTQSRTETTSLKQALIKGLADDGGLFMPSKLPKFARKEIEAMRQYSFTEIAKILACAILGDFVSRETLEAIVEESFNFPVKLVAVEPKIWSLELFHGPTLSFKDFGARFMARLFHHLLASEEKRLNILVATSGDTGSAAAHGFFKVPGIHVWILYPKGKVSTIQEQQMTTLGHNVTALEVEGTFDDCQRLVKEAFRDRDLNRRVLLTSANSINVGRLIPQSFYYFYAYSRLPEENLPAVISVPSGNFGNLTGGLLAKRMGLPIERFIAATNVNDIIPKFLATGDFSPRPSISTISNAMDVGNPSNFCRMMDLYDSDRGSMTADIFGASFDDSRTKEAIDEVKKSFGYLMDPHGAVAYLGLKKYLEERKGEVNGIFLETAHPAKFSEVADVAIPMKLQECLAKKKMSHPLPADYPKLKDLLQSSL